jgi:LptA/(LptD N-terminal domain) LPS transport protein
MVAIQEMTSCFSVKKGRWLQPLRLLLSVCFLVLSSVSLAEESTTDIDLLRKELDWVPLEQLTEEQKSQLPTACCGAYFAPLRTDSEADLKPEEASLFGRALDSESEKQSRITLTGNVLLTQGNRTICTDKFFLDKDTGRAHRKHSGARAWVVVQGRSCRYQHQFW